MKLKKKKKSLKWRNKVGKRPQPFLLFKNNIFFHLTWNCICVYKCSCQTYIHIHSASMFVSLFMYNVAMYV